MSEKKFLYWMAVSESDAVRFSDLAHMMAKAMYPTDAELDHYGVTRLTLEDELPNVVRDGGLMVRNPAGLGALTYPHGAVLQSAVILPHDLRPFLAERCIELRLNPHGGGPDYWTLENAAAALQAQEGWHDGTRAEFQDQLQEAAQRGEIPIRDPQTCLPIKSPQPRTYWELVTPADVNAWLEKQGAPYRWHVDATEGAPEPQAAPLSNGPLPLTTGDIAFCFDGIHWSEKKWRKPLGDQPKWLKSCVVIPGQRGVSETRWNPVLIAAALVHNGHVQARSVRARFQSKPQLIPWLDAWKTYEADYLDND